MKELLTPGGEHHGIGDGDVLVMTKIEDPLSRAPNGHQIWPLDEEQEMAAAPSRETRLFFLPDFFPGNKGFYSIGLRVSGATRWAAPT